MPDERADLNPEKTDKNAAEKPKKPKSAKEKAEEKARRQAELEEEQKRKKQEEEYQKELKMRRMKRKLITPGVMLVTGLIASVTMFFMKFENFRMLIWLLAILVVSGIAGRLIQYMFERFARQNEEAALDEGEVINKGSAVNGDADGEANG